MPLSEFGVKAAKPKEKPYKLADSGGPYLLVQPNGSKLWRLKYRYAEKEKTLAFGPYPLITIAEAREKRDQAKKLLLNGVDPSAKRQEEKIAAATSARTTFGLIVEEYIERMKERNGADATITKIKWLLEDLASPMSKRPIKEITRLKSSRSSKRSRSPGGESRPGGCVVSLAPSSDWLSLPSEPIPIPP